MRARDVMSTPVVAVTPTTPLHQAAALLTEHGFTALPVVDTDMSLVGMVTEAELLRDRVPGEPVSVLSQGVPPSPRPPPEHAVAAVMRRNVPVRGPDADAAVLARVMVEQDTRTIPILDGDTIVGIVSRRDLLRTLIRDDDAIELDIRELLARFAGPRKWQVSVRDGMVTLSDELNNSFDLRVATLLARSVPGVVRVLPVLLSPPEAVGNV